MVKLIYENLPREIVLSKKRRPIYYKKKDKLPVSFEKSDEFYFDSENILCYKGEKVIKNFSKLDKPRTLRINGNLYKSLNILPSQRNKINSELKEFFRQQTQHLELDAPVFIEFKFCCPRKDIEDINNYDKFYIDAFFDALINYDIRIERKNKKNTQVRIKRDAPFRDDNVDFIRGYTSVFEESLKIELHIKIYNFDELLRNR